MRVDIVSKWNVDLPQNYVDYIEASNLSRKYKTYCYQFMSLLIYKGSLYFDEGARCEVSLAKTYFIKVFNKHYHRWLKIALQSGCIDVEHRIDESGKRVETYVVGKIFMNERGELIEVEGKAKSYYICFDKLSKKTKRIELSKVGNISESRVMELVIDSDDYAPLLIDNIRLLRVDRERLDKVSHFLAATVRTRLFINNEIKDERVTVRISDLKYHTEFSPKEVRNNAANLSLEGALEEARMQRKHLILDGNICRIAKANEYIIQKRWGMLDRYNSALDILTQRPYLTVAENGRVHTPISELSKYHLAVLIIDNGLTEIDVVNAQYAFTAMWLIENGMNTTQDAQLFINLAFSGKLYAYVMKETGWSKEDAKMAMMRTWFSSHRGNFPEKIEIKKLFGSVIESINNFKKECEPEDENDFNPYGQFANEMQKRESNLIIQLMLPELLNNCGVLQEQFVLTRHDSILIKDFQPERVLRFIESKAKSYGYDVTFKMGNDKYHQLAKEAFRYEFNPQMQKPIPPVIEIEQFMETIKTIRHKYSLSSISNAYETDAGR